MNTFVFGSMVGGVLLLDLFLSGDNVLIIGAAAAGLQRRQRWYAILVGGLVAMILRIILTALASVVLNIPFIQIAGAIVLLYLAQKLLRERTQIGNDSSTQSDELSHLDPIKRRTQTNNAFLSALLTILLADITMSLDNVIAVGALANGEIWPLIIGLIGSITILMLGSAVVSVLIERLRWILDIAAFVLGWTSALMLHDDLTTLAAANHATWLLTLNTIQIGWNFFHLSLLIVILLVITSSIIFIFDLYYRKKDHQQAVIVVNTKNELVDNKVKSS
ncbi:YjbE family putative metal transport protein [Dictyobacter arantiisoli]|nr:YjbE family putative metal transport protein [Dictyobacter arantiisoli]